MDLVGCYADDGPCPSFSKSEGGKAQRDSYTVTVMQPLDLGIVPAPTDVAEVECVQVCYSSQGWAGNFGKRVQMKPVDDDAKEPDEGCCGEVAGPG